MRPLVSGPEAKRYEEPETDTYLLFPYERNAAGRMHLISADALHQRFPQAWAYLKSYEEALRAREKGAFDDTTWFRFGRNQSSDKQDQVKLIIPRLVRTLKSALDGKGQYYLDNVDVGGVIGKDRATAAFLNGILNGGIANFVFKRISKPFRNNYLSANKQFIASLPVPVTNIEERAAVAWSSRRLQRLRTSRRHLLHSISERLSVLARSNFGERWLWSDLPSAEDLEVGAPARLQAARERRDWADERARAAVETRRGAFGADLARGGRLEARFEDGELRLLSGGAPILSRIYLDPELGELVQAYWRWLLLGDHSRDAKTLEKALRNPPTDAASPAARQFIERVARLGESDVAIAREEAAMNARLAELYRLTPEERRLIEAG